MPIDLNSITNTIKTGITGIAQSSLKDYLPQAEIDGQTIVNEIKTNIQTWTTQLTSGEISADDLKFMILSNEEMLKVAALTQAGILQIELDKFKQQVANLIVNTLLSAVKV